MATHSDESPRTAALQWLYGRINYERTTPVPYQQQAFKLDAVRELLRRLGDPQDGMRIVHIAGTKGKGTVGAMIAAALTRSGHKTGVYSSPHLERFEERIAIDGVPCSEQELVRLIDTVRPIAEAMDLDGALSPTFFDLSTAMALLHFDEQEVNAAVIEVGLGGRLDSTNVVEPTLCVITSVSLDHTQQLGETTAEIAAEKAGIVKDGVPVVCGVGDDEARRVIERVCREHDAGLAMIDRDFACCQQPTGDWEYSQRDSDGFEELGPLRFKLPGEAHARNGATALAALGALASLGLPTPTEARRTAVTKTTLPARMERFDRDPLVVIDAAHNAASARALSGAIDRLCDPAPVEQRVLVVAISQEKDAEAILREIVPHFRWIIATRFLENPRALPPETIAELVSTIDSAAEVTTAPSPQDAYLAAVDAAGQGGAVVVAGSFFLAAEIRRLVVNAD